MKKNLMVVIIACAVLFTGTFALAQLTSADGPLYPSKEYRPEAAVPVDPLELTGTWLLSLTGDYVSHNRSHGHFDVKFQINIGNSWRQEGWTDQLSGNPVTNYYTFDCWITEQHINHASQAGTCNFGFTNGNGNNKMWAGLTVNTEPHWTEIYNLYLFYFPYASGALIEGVFQGEARRDDVILDAPFTDSQFEGRVTARLQKTQK